MSAAPNTTLYINNLNDKINKEELKSQLYSLFMTYGRVLDVVAQKGTKMKGQAFLVFSDLAEATAAMRACEGFTFYDKPMHIQYAKTKSYATLRREDPDFVPPSPANPKSKQQPNVASQNGAEKRRREDGGADGDARQTKRERADEDADEMELEDEDDTGAQDKSQPAVLPVQQQRSARLLCTNLPQEVTDEVLSVLFQQYQGFNSTHVAQAPTPTPTGARAKMAQVIFESADLASVAKEALDGFTLKRGWNMTVAYI